MSVYYFNLTHLDSRRWHIDRPGAQAPESKRAAAIFKRAKGIRKKVGVAAVKAARKAGYEVVVIRGIRPDGTEGTLDAFPIVHGVGHPYF